MIDGGDIIICDKCKGAGEDQAYGSDDNLYWRPCEKCEGSGLVHRVSTHKDTPWKPARRAEKARS